MIIGYVNVVKLLISRDESKNFLMMAKMYFIETCWTYYNTSYLSYDDKQIFIILHGYIAPQVR